jgi:hypothetical protein
MKPDFYLARKLKGEIPKVDFKGKEKLPLKNALLS